MPSVVPSLLFLAAAALSVSVTAIPHEHNHAHQDKRALPGTWYHAEDHPVHALFKRGDTDGVNYPAVGTPEWSAGFPEKIDPNALPQAWVDAYNAAVKAGNIPDVPVSTMSADGNPVYPDGLDPNGPTVCSATYKCQNKEDLWDAPDGVFGSSFDDGPLDTSMPLYELLHENNLVTTHFMIGVNIMYNPTEFLYAFETLHSDIAVHTWTHPYMTTLSSMQLLGEFGYTMEIIHNSTGGRVPKYWRPPYGDSDERVRAIAKEVFGLTTVIWNQDTEDWSIGSAGGATRDEVNANLEKWITGPKSPGLIILEHELSNETTGAFIQAFPLIAQNGWKFESVARLDGGTVYQNSPNSTADVESASVGDGTTLSYTTSTAASSSSAASGSGSSSKTSASSKPTSGSAVADTNGAMTLFATPAVLVTCMSLLGAAFALS